MITLSPEEQALVRKYYDPDIDVYLDTGPVKVKKKETRLSNLEHTASVDSIWELAHLNAYEQVVIKLAERQLGVLKSLDSWEGEEIIDLT
jgi:hypothetical protein